MDQILQKIYEIGIIPVIAIDNADKAVPLARALVKGGLPAAEVTFRTAAGEEAIRRIAAEVPEVLVGAGTVLSVEQCDRALAAGAKFIVSPGYNEILVAHCLEKGVPAVVTETPLDAEALQAQFAARGFKATAELQVMSGPAVSTLLT